MQADALNMTPAGARSIAWLPLMVAAGAMLAVATTLADTPAPGDSQSPWLLVPTLSSNPKLGTSLGGMGAYMYYFDPQSKPSLFGTSAQYTSTDSIVATLFVKTSFAADHQRLHCAFHLRGQFGSGLVDLRQRMNLVEPDSRNDSIAFPFH